MPRLSAMLPLPDDLPCCSKSMQLLVIGRELSCPKPVLWCAAAVGVLTPLLVALAGRPPLPTGVSKAACATRCAVGPLKKGEWDSARRSSKQHAAKRYKQA
jgi:hypothetical protein